MFLDFVRDFVGAVDSGYDFILILTACVLLVVVSSLIIGFFSRRFILSYYEVF